MNLASAPRAITRRRIVKSFSVRLDLLEKLEERVPFGDRSAFLEMLLSRELERPGTGQRVAQ